MAGYADVLNDGHQTVTSIESCCEKGMDGQGHINKELYENENTKMKIETIGDSLYWSYANLAMAHAAVSAGDNSYQQKHFIVRGKLYIGLRKGTMKIGPFFRRRTSNADFAPSLLLLRRRKVFYS